MSSSYRRSTNNDWRKWLSKKNYKKESFVKKRKIDFCSLLQYRCSNVWWIRRLCYYTRKSCCVYRKTRLKLRNQLKYRCLDDKKFIKYLEKNRLVIVRPKNIFIRRYGNWRLVIIKRSLWSRRGIKIHIKISWKCC